MISYTHKLYSEIDAAIQTGPTDCKVYNESLHHGLMRKNVGGGKKSKEQDA
jgi:hypothetical protein